VDGGRTWGAPSVMLHSTTKLDYPQWLNLQGQVSLAVNTSDQGLKVLPFAK